MANEKPVVRNVEAHYIEVHKDPKSSTWNGEYKEELCFIQSWTGKRQTIFKMQLSPTNIAYLEERIALAKENLRARFNSDMGDI